MSESHAVIDQNILSIGRNSLVPQALYNQSLWKGAILIPASVIRNNQITVTTTAQQLSTTSVPVLSVRIKAFLGNTNAVFVGNASLTAINGHELSPGESITLVVSDLNLVYVIVAADTETISYITLGANSQTTIAI